MPGPAFRLCSVIFIITCIFSVTKTHAQLTFCGSSDNDVYRLLHQKDLVKTAWPDITSAIGHAPAGSGLLIIAQTYPLAGIAISQQQLDAASQKNLKVYIEYPSSIPGMEIGTKPFVAKLERGVVTGKDWNGRLAPMSLLSINGCHLLPVKAADPLIVLAKVAGFDKAEYGYDDVPSYNVLLKKDNMLIATTALSNFATGRYAPRASWRAVWDLILDWLTDHKAQLTKPLPSYVHPMYDRDQPLPPNARRQSIAKGVEWFYKGRLLIHPLFMDTVIKRMGNGLDPFGPPIDQRFPAGDGTLGILEGHGSNIYYDGTQQYRYWIRADVQGEAAFALASAGKLLGKKEYFPVAQKLSDYIFANSNLRSGPLANKDSAAFGLIGWATTHPHVFYGDDNARAILGLIGAESLMNSHKWDKEIAEAIMANFRTTGINGFRGDALELPKLRAAGWRHFQDSTLISPHPHYESWIWACYLWLYEQTGYKPLLEKTKKAIRITMDAYPDHWLWTNGIQQERARMILPLAWLVRVEDTKEHRHWLDLVVRRLLESQQPCGAIREELGGEGTGYYGTMKSNKEYGLNEAPLIFKNGDEIADMLYTSNFAFFSLNEAAAATGDTTYRKAVDRLADFLVRIQVKSERHPDIDGAWFRAFDYGRWDYWASNADAGWGAWCTLTGWIQTWIVATQALVVQKTSYWETTRPAGKGIRSQMPLVIEEMK